MIPRPPPLPASLPAFPPWQVQLKPLLLLLGQQWKHFTRVVNLLTRFSLWYLFSSPPPPSSTYISLLRLQASKTSLAATTRFSRLKSTGFFPSHLKFCSHFLSIKRERLTKGLGEFPLVMLFPVHVLCLTWFSFFFKFTRPSGFGLSHSQVKLYFYSTSTEEVFFLILSPWVMKCREHCKIQNDVITDMCKLIIPYVITSPTGISLLFTL